MSADRDILAARYEAELGPRAVETDGRLLAAYEIDGLAPSIRCIPESPEELSAALRIAAEASAAVIPWGGGTSMALGNLPHRYDVALSLNKLTRLIEHDDANLSATVEAGMTIASLQARLAERRQFLPVDPPLPELATVGGAVAAGLSGFRRAFYGGIRDRVLGMKVVLAGGGRIKAGGKVMKNVAGYDMCKLFAGSLGTLGIISEITFKLAPRPEREASLVARGELADVCRLAGKIREAKSVPAAMVIAGGGAISAEQGFLVALRTEGFDESVSRHLRDARQMATKAALECEVLDGIAHDRFWEKFRDFGASGKKILYRVTVPIAAVSGVVEAAASWSGPAGGARVVADAAAGSIYLALEATDKGAAWFPKLCALAGKEGGHAVMVASPARFKRGLDVWGAPPPGLEIMREIKRRLDPGNILSPGRFVTGL